jgi:glycosyltransferase involved in cell wall biosynthesis
MVNIIDLPKLNRNDARIIKLFKWCINTVLKTFGLIWYLLCKVDKSSILHAHEDTTLIGLFLWVVILKRKGVWDPHDYFQESSGRVFRYRVWMEKKIMAREVSTIVVSLGMQNMYKQLYPKNTSILVKNLFFSEKSRTKLNDIEKILQKRNRDITSPIKIIYFGQLKEDRLDITLVKEIYQLDGVELHLYGLFRKHEYEQAIAQYTALPNSNIFFHGRYSTDNIMSILEEYHFAIFPFLLNRQNINFCLPNKFFQCIEARLPMIMSNMEEMGTLLNTYHLGYVFPDRDYESLKQLLASIDVKSEEYTTMLKNIVFYETNHVNYDIERQHLLQAYYGA